VVKLAKVSPDKISPIYIKPLHISTDLKVLPMVDHIAHYILLW